MQIVRKLATSAVLLAMVLSVFASNLTPVSAQSSVGAVPPAELSPCKFDVGIGDSKYQVDALCTVVQVPENYSNPTGKKLDLHVTVLPATSKNKQPIPVFHFEGGPGASAIQNFGQTFYGAYRLLREDHDVVLIDQRGTGLSSSLQCTEITDQALADLDKPEDVEEDSATFIKRIADCLQRISQTTDPANYTSTIFADDTDLVRQALGYDQIDVYGSSYGTWLAQIYLRRHGDKVHAMILDSVAGPWNFYLLASASNAEAALNKVFDLCVADAECNKIYPDLPGKLQTAIDRLDKRPAQTAGIGVLTGKSYPVVMTRSRFLETLRSMLYLGANVSIVPQIISEAAKGNFSMVASQAVLEAEVAPQISFGLYYSVHCSESLPFYTPDEIKKYEAGRFFGIRDNGVEQLQAVCKAWRSAELDPADVAPVKSDRPVLIFVGQLDPITSVAFGEETHARLTHSTLAVFPYQAHGPLVGSKCAQVMAKSFFDAPDKPVDTTCTRSDIKPIFMGAYAVKLVPYSDPQGRFTATVPEGWAKEPGTAADPLTFFASADKVQLLGMGIFNNTSSKDAQAKALEAISKAYGPVDVQLTESILFITVVQHGLDRPDQAYVGLLLTQSLGINTKVVWLAAPGNIVQAILLPVAIPVFSSLEAK